VAEQCGIYKITCKNNSKFYIGSSININRRLRDHIRLLKRNKHKNKRLQDSWDKYGEENFKYEIVETINDVKQLHIREKWWIDNTNCYKKEIGFNISSDPRNPPTGGFIDLTGQKFGKLKPTKYLGESKWLCLCDCGKEKIINSKSFKNGHTKSCGCLYKDNKNGLKHGYYTNKKTSKIHKIWKHMIERCTNPNVKQYKDYGGRKIRVCYRWSNKNPKGFENFYKDVGDPPKGKSLDRANNNKGYYPNNWRWATPKEQANNRRNSILITFNNKTQSLQKWAIKYNINPNRLWRRLYQLNWPIEKTLITPIKKIKRRLNDN